MKQRAWLLVFTVDMQLCYLSAFYLVATGAAPSTGSSFVSIGRLLLSIALYGAWGVIINDYVDKPLDAAAGKRTGLEDVARWQVYALLAIIPAIGFLLLPHPGSNPFAPLLLAASYLLAFGYSAPRGRRLKEKGVWGSVTDAIIEKSLPSLVLFASFGHLGIEALAIAIFGAGIGMVVAALHQVRDYEFDRKWGVRTWAVQIGKDALLRVYRRFLLPFFFAGAGLTFAVIVLNVKAVGLALLAIFVAAGAVLTMLVRKGLVRPDDPERWRGVSDPGAGVWVWYVFTFFAGPVPTILGLAVVLRAPVFLPILGVTLFSQVFLFLSQYRWAIQKVLLAVGR